MDKPRVAEAYELARQQYARLGVDCDVALQKLQRVSLSLHCWQGDDVAGFEAGAAGLSGGIQVTGNYPGKARNPDELRRDMQQALALIPGRHRVNLHAMYGEFKGKKVDRDAIESEHFRGWLDWARAQGVCIDFNATCFSHPRAQAGFTLSSRDGGIRRFWIEHVRRCRRISAFLGEALGDPCLHNLWIPDGSKEAPASRWLHRRLLNESLDEIYAERFAAGQMKDALEGKLFGIGSESFVVGSHEFYLGYALSRGLIPCLDLGHYHPSESVADKISALLPFFPELLIHFSRGVRWDSDHVVILSDEILALTEEIVRADALERVHAALDYFDASLNRIGAWVLGARAVLQAFLRALLQPQEKLQELEAGNDSLAKLALLEELKLLPAGAVWDFHCQEQNIPLSGQWPTEIRRYEHDVLSRRQ